MDKKIVPTNVTYNSFILAQNLITLNRVFPFLNIQIAGTSVLGNPIYVVKLGNGPNHVFYSGSIHSNEWITSVVLMRFIEDYCNAYVKNEKLYNYSVRSLFKSSSIYIMPMVNPDGVDLVTGNLNTNSLAYKRANMIANNYSFVPFPDGWKANIHGVDLKNYQPFSQSLICT